MAGAGTRNVQIKFSGNTQGLEEASSTASKSFERVSNSTEGVRRGFDRAGSSTRNSGDRLTRFGKTADDVDTRAMGFRDSLTGVQDTMMGVGDISRGNTLEGLISLGSGFSDLGSSVYNGLAPVLSSVRTRFRNVRMSASSTRGALKKIGTTGAIFGGITAGAFALDAALGDDVEPNIDAVITGIDRIGRTGDVSGESARAFGSDLGALEGASQEFGSGFTGTIAEMGASIPLFNKIPNAAGNSASEMKQAAGTLDTALAQMAEGSPQKADQAFAQLATRMGLTEDETNNLRGQLPQYAAARENATAKDKLASQELERQVDALKKATDPVFNLTSSLNEVRDAQNRYNGAVAQYGPQSQQARNASWEVAQAVAGAEAAAKNGDLSFGAFQATLNRWVQQGIITQVQADNIAARVANTRSEAERYRNNYAATLSVQDNATPQLQGINNLINTITQPHTVPMQMQAGVTTTGIGGLLHVPPRAKGGTARAGRTHLVGESGPELFTPGRTGSVAPNSALDRGGGGMSANEVRAAVRDGIAEGLSASRLDVDGRGVATLVNKYNRRNARRGG